MVTLRDKILRHDQNLNATETAPTGDDYNEVLRMIGMTEGPQEVSLLISGVPVKAGQIVQHREFGSVMLQFSDEHQWHYQRFGHAGYDKDLENLTPNSIEAQTELPRERQVG